VPFLLNDPIPLLVWPVSPADPLRRHRAWPTFAVCRHWPGRCNREAPA